MPLFRVTTHEVVFKTYTVRAKDKDAARDVIQDAESEDERVKASVELVMEDESAWEVLDVCKVKDNEQAAEERRASK